MIKFWIYVFFCCKNFENTTSQLTFYKILVKYDYISKFNTPSTHELSMVVLKVYKNYHCERQIQIGKMYSNNKFKFNLFTISYIKVYILHVVDEDSLNGSMGNCIANWCTDISWFCFLVFK